MSRVISVTVEPGATTLMRMLRGPSSRDSASDMEGMDVAIRLGALTDSTLTARPIAECRRLVLAKPGYLRAVASPARRATCPRYVAPPQPTVAREPDLVRCPTTQKGPPRRR